MGALAAGRSPADLAPFTDYANAVGEAFQIADDILDVTSTAEAMGKSTGADAAHEKMTAVTVYGLDGAKNAWPTSPKPPSTSSRRSPPPRPSAPSRATSPRGKTSPFAPPTQKNTFPFIGTMFSKC